MPRYQRHVFICINKRPPEDPKGCCSAKGSEEVRAQFKKGLKDRGLNRIVRANAAGCLDACGFGTTVVVYPEAVWYGGVTLGDVEEIIERHIVAGEVVERLVMKPYAGGPNKFPPLDISSLSRPANVS
ncbi:MAG TPA: (2Fe-2S) ferredoxin domain-containing protein [Patescibacteria group bacterium]|jgi:(2Fe-2S) ferredoxin|nr:(2Fe-2S) ferredoxin domain-containing protein [Patescibacteria group bacterium]